MCALQHAWTCAFQCMDGCIRNWYKEVDSIPVLVTMCTCPEARTGSGDALSHDAVEQYCPKRWEARAWCPTVVPKKVQLATPYSSHTHSL